MRRGEVPWCPEEQRIVVQNYYRGHLTKEELEVRDASIRLYREATELGENMAAHASPKIPTKIPTHSEPSSKGSSTLAASPISSSTVPSTPLSPTTPMTSEPLRDANFVNFVKYTAWPTLKKWILHGVDQD